MWPLNENEFDTSALDQTDPPCLLLCFYFEGNVNGGYLGYLIHLKGAKGCVPVPLQLVRNEVMILLQWRHEESVGVIVLLKSELLI